VPQTAVITPKSSRELVYPRNSCQRIGARDDAQRQKLPQVFFLAAAKLDVLVRQHEAENRDGHQNFHRRQGMQMGKRRAFDRMEQIDRNRIDIQIPQGCRQFDAMRDDGYGRTAG